MAVHIHHLKSRTKGVERNVASHADATALAECYRPNFRNAAPHDVV